VIEKVLIYATSTRGLLVFDEPDFSEVPLQVPGGTVDPGEVLLEAARREFEEETGLQVESAFRFLGSVAHEVIKEGERLTLHRTYQSLVGKAKSTDAEAMTLTTSTSVRQIEPGQPVTHDFRDNRLTIETDPASGLVVAASCG
jgi:8-oxo-dGTP pyrophosphatase MutT (NUDIX family)